MASKLPGFMFYPGDWMKDPALRAVSIQARGLWIDMLCLMWESARRGYLVHATGHAVTTEQLARMTGCRADDVASMCKELEDCGVCSRTGDGILYSRRMERDERKRMACSEAGKRGGNPTLKGQSKGTPKGGPKGMSKGDPNPNPTPSVSVSVSTTEIERDISACEDSPPPENPPTEPTAIPPEIEQAAFETYGGTSPLTYLRQWLGAHPPEWIVEALKRTQAAGARNPRYTDRILAGWMRDGYPREDHSGNVRGIAGKAARNDRASHRETPTYVDRTGDRFGA